MRAYLVDEQGRTFAVVIPAAESGSGWVAAPLSWGDDAPPSGSGPTARAAWRAMTKATGGMICRPFDTDTAAALRAEKRP